MKKFFAGFRKSQPQSQLQAALPQANAKAKKAEKHVINTKNFDADFAEEATQLQTRIESTKNYPIQAALPTPENPFVVSVFLKEPLPLEETSSSQCVIELRTAAPKAEIQRAPLELCLVLDRSGSMSGSKLTQAKEAVSLVVNSSDPRDILHFVVYDDQADVIFRDGKLAQKKQLCESIAGVQARGGTSLHSGLKAAMDILQKSEQGYAKRIFLFSDGQDGGNPTGDALCGVVASWLQQGVNTSAFGIGTDFDAEIMKGIASAGGGGFVYISNSEEIPQKVKIALGALQSLAVKDLNLTIQTSEGVTLTNTYTYTGFSNGVNLGTMSASDRKQILLELKVNPKECELKSAQAVAASAAVAAAVGPAVSAVSEQKGDEEPVPPGAEEQGQEEKKEEAQVANKPAAEGQSTVKASAFRWTLTYVDVQSSTEKKMSGEAFATLTKDSKLLAKASEHPLVVVTAVVAGSADKDAAVLDLLNNGSDEAITSAISIKKQSVELLKAVEHLDEMGAVTWLVKRMTATCAEMESRANLQKMRQDVNYELYQASSNLQCAGLV